ncbi:metal-dependent hydrolase [Halobellus rufus]|uniref:metal-dependent hydrolase n=1 Tax=Halobellus rufus TaxID=1448860 RepID=UPI000679BE0F|nr:metal-dependent hydrolase [Halobellus rufus]
MFVGHEFLAFALAGWGASRLGGAPDTALRLGAVAALAALLPDLDVLYAAVTYAAAVAGGTPLGWEAFWGVANGVHRVVTHPLPVGVAAAFAFGLGAVVDARASTSGSASGSLGVIGVAALPTALYAPVLVLSFRTAVGAAAAIVAGAFLAVVAVAGVVVGRRLRLPTTAVTAAAAVGFLTHPFGDVFLAAPPPLLSPFGPPVLTERVALAADPTLEIFGVLFVELAAVWLGVLVALDLGRAEAVPRPQTPRFAMLRRLRDSLDRRAGVGFAYAVAVVALPRPTVVDAHILGFTIVPLAVVVGLWASLRHREGGLRSLPSTSPLGGGAVTVGIVTGVATLTLAAIAYVVTYELSAVGVLPVALG